MAFRKMQPGRMGILTIPQGTRLYQRRDDGKTSERARKEFDVLAMPSWAGSNQDGQPVYSFKMYDEYWYVLKADIPKED